MSKRYLTLDIGAANVVLAEYEGGKGALTLVNYGKAALAEPIDVSNADTVLPAALMEIVREKGIKPGPVAISVSGQMVFPRFAAIAYTGDDAKFEQLIRYEVEQNIPFPIDEMICDSQVLGDTENGDKAVMVVAAKTDQIEAITSAVAGAGFTPERVSVAPIAVTGALGCVLAGDESCKVILDIGAKTTSLVVVEGERIYNRSIPVAGNTITNEIAKALGCTTEEAEQIKLEKGYVSLGGVVEDEDEVADRVSKVCRAVLTRLHAEISRSINFYRSQQGGGAPTALYVTGGTALLPQLDAFFSESLQVEVGYFNPMDAVTAGAALDQEQLGVDWAFLGATTGLALEATGDSRYTINLLPPSIISERAAAAKIPFLALGALAFVGALVVALLAVKHAGTVVDAKLEAVEGKRSELQRFEQQIKTASAAEEAAKTRAEALRALLVRRGQAVIKLNAVRSALGDGMWIEKWDGDRVTIRGWGERVSAFLQKVAEKNDGKRQTAPEIVVARLKGNPVVIPESVKIVDMTPLGKDHNVEQFVVEVKFK